MKPHTPKLASLTAACVLVFGIAQPAHALFGVGDIVLDLVVVGELPAAVGQREEERGDAEGDHDGGERQRLRQRVAEAGGVAVEDR